MSSHTENPQFLNYLCLPFKKWVSHLLCWMVATSMVLEAQSTNPNFPRAAVYLGTNSAGYPLIKDVPGVDLQLRPFDPEYVDAFSKWGLSILHATPLVDARKDMAQTLRNRNPNTRVFAYLMPATMWCGEGYLTYTYFFKYWRLLKEGATPSCAQDTNKFLFLQDGRSAYDVFTISNNLAYRERNPDNTYRYVLAERIAQLVYDEVISSKDNQGKAIVDGVFNDVFCTDIAWMESPDTQFDHVRAGYTDHAEFLAGWRAGAMAYATKLRALAGPSYQIIGNCGTPEISYRSKFNGWMSENWPWQNGGSWYSNMYGSQGGYLHLDTKAVAPQLSILSAWIGGPYTTSTPLQVNPAVYSPTGCKTFRYSLGSASLGNGYADVVPDGGTPTVWPKWAFPELLVDPGKAELSDKIEHGGWLGQSSGEYDQLIWAQDNSVLPNSSFETDLSNWRLTMFSPAVGSFSRETMGAPHGGAALHTTLTTPGAGGWQFSVSPVGTFNVDAYSTYSVTFWAKAGTQGHPLDIAFVRPSDGFTHGSVRVPLTTNWKRYQIFLQATQTGGSHFRFDLGLNPGDVWFDNIQFQQGVSSVYRRKFKRGMVLVNPSQFALNDIQLDQTYRKLRDTREVPTLCPGYLYASDEARRASMVSIPAQDALFLMNLDTIAPSAIGPLSVTAR